jgi:hypothetical protein
MERHNTRNETDVEAGSRLTYAEVPKVLIQKLLSAGASFIDPVKVDALWSAMTVLIMALPPLPGAVYTYRK